MKLRAPLHTLLSGREMRLRHPIRTTTFLSFRRRVNLRPQFPLQGRPVGLSFAVPCWVVPGRGSGFVPFILRRIYATQPGVSIVFGPFGPLER
jgi:hypothetical protein